MVGLLPLIPFLPFLSAVFTFLIRDSKRKGKVSTYITGISLSLSLLLLITGSFGEVRVGSFLDVSGDRLGLLLSTYILLVSLVVHKFSINYMRDDPGESRFFLLLDLMTAVLLFLVLSSNLLTIAMSWSLMGVLLYLLLLHNTKSENAKRFASYTLITHLLADIPLLLAFFLLYREAGSLYLGDVFKVSGETASLVTLLIVISACMKSAQFPFHLWIVYSMEGPTPVSALMHAGIVNAGAFLVNRFSPLFVHDEWGLQLAFLIGSVTAVLGSALMLIQNDVKRALGYSTVGQMGYMIMEIGVGAFALAVYHMMAHGIFKATLFLYSGNVIHNARRDPNVPEDEVYRAVVKREDLPSKVPWLVYGLLTVVVPLLVVLLTHLLVDVEIVRYETALILLFFGWITGVQVLVSTFRVGRENPIRTALLVILSMAVVMLGYAFLGHTLQSFLYPSKELVEKIYEVAFGSVPVFVAELVLIGLIILAGWLFLYYASREKHLPFHNTVYVFLSRELYVPDIYSLVRYYFLKLSGFVGKLTFAPATVPVYAFFVSESQELSPFFLLALLGVPLFPLSLLVFKVVREFGPFAVLILTLLGALAFSFYKQEVWWVQALALTSSFLHGIRLFRVRNLKDLTAEIYCSVVPLVWFLPEPGFVVVAGIGPLLIGVFENILRSRLGTSEMKVLGGMVTVMPLTGWTLLILVLYSAGVPPFGPSLLKFLPSLTGSSLLLTALSASWFLITAGSLLRIGDLLFGRGREDLFFTDSGKLGVLFPLALVLLSSVLGYALAEEVLR